VLRKASRATPPQASARTGYGACKTPRSAPVSIMRPRCRQRC